MLPRRSLSSAPTDETGSDAAARLTLLVAEELDRPAPEQARAVTDEIRRRHGEAVAAILFYGSCLRRGRADEGVLDFYVLVHSYREAYPSRHLRWLNSILPPNVFYLEMTSRGATLRAKYAVITLEDFASAAKPSCRHSIVWGRFSQPALLVYADDAASGQAVARTLATCIITMMERAALLALDSDGKATIDADRLWLVGLEASYASEVRPETAVAIDAVYRAAPERYQAAASEALTVLDAEGRLLSQTDDGRVFSLSTTPGRRAAEVRAWRRSRPLAKCLYFARLVKTAFTFGDWLPYVLWKLNRHTGVTVELSERQRRYPLLFGWPVVIRLLRQQTLR